MHLYKFNPPWWLKNRHMQSCISSIFQKQAVTPLRWEQLELPDGDFIELAWAGPDNAPLIVILHGLEGSVESHYIQGMLDPLVNQGWQTVTMHFRGCGRQINRMPYSYNAGGISDFQYLLDTLLQRIQNQPIAVIGFSLGANILLRYLALCSQIPVCAAVAISTPFELGKCVDHMPVFYQWHLLKKLKDKLYKKLKMKYDLPVSKSDVSRITTLRDYDQKVTVPLHGYSHVNHYYAELSCRYLLRDVKTPTLMLHAADDPLVPESCIPKNNEINPNCILQVSDMGGHIGFMLGVFPWQRSEWLNNRIIGFLQPYLKSS